jgi:membrane-associated HD superfamily phosphohydrolase
MLNLKEAVIVPEMVEKEVAKSEVGKASVEQIEKVFSESPARVFFDMILEDAANLVKTGKDLEVLVADKNQLTGVEIAEGQIISDVQIANEKLTQEISRLLNNASKKDLDKEFKIVSQSFMESFDKLQELADKLKDAGRIKGNKLSLQIQARKQEINKIFKAVGGPENFDKVKKWVKGVEMVQTRYAEDNGDHAFATRSSQAIYTFLNENREDLPVVTSTASSGSKFSAVDIITIMAMSSKTKLF